MTRNGRAYRQRLWVPAISGTAGGALPTPVAQTGAGGPKRLDGGSGARQMLTDAGFPRAAGAPSSLPTPRANSAMTCELHGQADKPNPNLETVIGRMLPTPTASDAIRGNTPETQRAHMERKGRTGSQMHWPLSVMAQLLSTPTVNDSRNSTLPPSQRGRDSLPGQMLRDDSIPTGAATYLNPSFVEEMMGFPLNWTKLED